MNKRTDREGKLIAEAFHGDWDSGPAAGFARAAAAQARRQKRLRQACAGAGALATILLICFFAAQLQRPAPPSKRMTSLASPSKSTARGFEIISDDELLVLHRKPLMVVQRENGTREFVLLEPEPKSDSSD